LVAILQIAALYLIWKTQFYTKEVFLKNVTTASGLPLRLSDNAFMFKNVTVKQAEGAAKYV
jgi:hypothetical protein